MRWNLLFEELENGFDQLRERAAENSARSHPSTHHLPPHHHLRQILSQAKHSRSPLIVRDLSGVESSVVPRAVGRDWFSCRVEGVARERIIVMDAVVSVTIQAALSTNPAPSASVSLTEVLRMWMARGSAIRLDTRTDYFLGSLAEVDSDGVVIHSYRAGHRVDWFVPRGQWVSLEGVDDARG